MRFEIDIEYPPSRMALSRKSMEARGHFRYVDRVPVNHCVVPRYFAAGFGLRYLDFFRDVETQHYWQLRFYRYQIEHIPSDACTGPTVYVHPYFDNAIPLSAQGAEIGWTEGGPPRAIPVIHSVEEMDRFEVARPDEGLRGKAIEWWRHMGALAAETKATFNGGRAEWRWASWG